MNKKILMRTEGEKERERRQEREGERDRQREMEGGREERRKESEINRQYPRLVFLYCRYVMESLFFICPN